MNKQAKEILQTLSANKFYAECPCCNENIPLSKANLFYSDKFNEKAEENYDLYLTDLIEQKRELKTLKDSISNKSEIGARAVNIGLILERIFPSLTEFPYCCEDCRSLFDPIDYLVFEGLATTGKVRKIFWVEIKTGGSRLNTHQREIKSLVDNKKLVWDVYSMEEHYE